MIFIETAVKNVALEKRNERTSAAFRKAGSLQVPVPILNSHKPRKRSRFRGCFMPCRPLIRALILSRASASFTEAGA